MSAGLSAVIVAQEWSVLCGTNTGDFDLCFTCARNAKRKDDVGWLNEWISQLNVDKRRATRSEGCR